MPPSLPLKKNTKKNSFSSRHFPLGQGRALQEVIKPVSGLGCLEPWILHWKHPRTDTGWGGGQRTGPLALGKEPAGPCSIQPPWLLRSSPSLGWTRQGLVSAEAFGLPQAHLSTSPACLLPPHSEAPKSSARQSPPLGTEATPAGQEKQGRGQEHDPGTAHSPLTLRCPPRQEGSAWGMEAPPSLPPEGFPRTRPEGEERVRGQGDVYNLGRSGKSPRFFGAHFLQNSPACLSGEI